jgi:hypothetical protein
MPTPISGSHIANSHTAGPLHKNKSFVISMYRKLQQAPCLTQRKAAETACARNQTSNNVNNREIRDCPVRAAVYLTTHSLYTITIHTNQPVLPTIPTRHTPNKHENTTTHKTHFPQVTHHPTTLHHPPYSHRTPYIIVLTIIP